MAKGFTLKEKGLADINKQLSALSRDVNNEASRALNKFVGDVVADAKQLVASNSSDEGNLLNSINPKNSTPASLEAEVNVTANYAAYIEFGTRKYAAKYVASLPTEWKAYAAQFKGKGSSGSMDEFIQSIMAWVQRKGIGGLTTASGNTSGSRASLDAMQQTAYAIALNIIQNGIKAKPFLYPSVIKNLPKLTENMEKLIK